MFMRIIQTVSTGSNPDGDCTSLDGTNSQKMKIEISLKQLVSIIEFIQLWY